MKEIKEIYCTKEMLELTDYWAGIDLHSNNHVIAIQDSNHQRIFRKKLSNDIEKTLACLARFKDRLCAITVESTYNWYWLVDGLMDAGYDVRLAHPAAINQYNGLKHTDDKDDAYFLAHLLCLGLLPEGYIYPKEERPVRDLNRKYRSFIQERTTHILSFKSFLNRSFSKDMSAYHIKKLTDEQVREMIVDKNSLAMAMADVETIRYLTHTIDKLEGLLLRQVKLKPEFERLMTLPGIGKVLAISISLETGPISRFPTPGDYASYCRCVESLRKSNKKIKGKNNRKNGNPYLSWAFHEAADKAKRYCPYAKKFFERKIKKGNIHIARNALAHKYAKACYHVLKDQVDYDVTRVFESAKQQNKPKCTLKIKGRVGKPDRGLDSEPLAPIGIAGATALS